MYRINPGPEVIRGAKVIKKLIENKYAESFFIN